MDTAALDRRILHVISHTHWDREWYLTFQQFRFRLVRLIDRLMDLLERDPGFRFFLLDAQTIAIEDYLAIKPQNRERLLRFVREGRIQTGPWYVQNDLYLTSGEATIRNLMIGHRMAAEYGGPGAVMKVGYLPDQFGNISQMPQILRGFGIATAVQGRGYDVRKNGRLEYWWEGPDGSRVLTSNLAFWYNNFERIPDSVEAAVARVDELEEMMGKISGSKHLLFMNGVDHFEAQENLAPMLRATNEARPEGGRLVHSTLPEYFAALEDEIEAGELQPPVHKGELRDGPSQGGLAGTLSSRVTLKQRNAKCQTLLEKYAEPLASIAHALGDDYPQDFFTYAWKLLMQNHPHDSICGCSQDQVHREMVPRFDQVEQVADELFFRAFATCAAHLPAPAPVEMPGRQTTFAVFNPLSFARTDIAEVTLDFPLGKPGRERGGVDPEADVEFVHIFDEAGKPVPYHVVRSEVVSDRVLSPTVLPMAQVFRRFTVQVRAENVPPLGFKTFRAVAQNGKLSQGNAGSTIATGAVGQKQSHVRRKNGNMVDNGLVSVEVYGDGTFHVQPNEDELPQLEYFNVFEDGGDVGDQYVYRAPRRDIVISAMDGTGSWELIEDTPLAVAYRATTIMHVPESSTQDRESRSEKRVPVQIETTVRLSAGQPYGEVITTVHNTAKDHRLRMLCTLGLPATTSVAQAPFDVIARERVPRERLLVVAGQHPHEQWVSAHGEPTDEDRAYEMPRGLTVFTEGLYEHELLRDDAGTLALTLLRCTDRLAMAPGDPLGHDRAEDAQCLGTHTFHYAVMPHKGTWEEEKVWKYAHAFNAPFVALQTPEAERGNPDYNEAQRDADALTRASYLTLEPDALVLSAYKRAHDRDTLIVRFWNIGTKSKMARVGVPGLAAAWRVSMDEERQESLPVSEQGTVSLVAGPKEIITLEFETTHPGLAPLGHPSPKGRGPRA